MVRFCIDLTIVSDRRISSQSVATERFLRNCRLRLFSRFCCLLFCGLRIWACKCAAERLIVSADEEETGESVACNEPAKFEEKWVMYGIQELCFKQMRSSKKRGGCARASKIMDTCLFRRLQRSCRKQVS